MKKKICNSEQKAEKNGKRALEKEEKGKGRAALE